MRCPCGSPDYESCCGVFHRDEAPAPTAEALMRSRYSAFALRKTDYLVMTTDPQTRDQFDHEAQAEWARQAEFTGLEILKAVENGNKGTVEFKARYRMNGQEETHHELSRFRRQGGSWYYRQGNEIKA